MSIKIRSREFGKNSSSANTTFTLHPLPFILHPHLHPHLHLLFHPLPTTTRTPARRPTPCTGSAAARQPPQKQHQQQPPAPPPATPVTTTTRPASPHRSTTSSTITTNTITSSTQVCGSSVPRPQTEPVVNGDRSRHRLAHVARRHGGRVRARCARLAGPSASRPSRLRGRTRAWR